MTSNKIWTDIGGWIARLLNPKPSPETEIMSTLLHINSSVRINGSASRQLTSEFVAKWQAAHPNGRIVERDLAVAEVPHLTEQTIGAFFTPADQRSAEQLDAVRLSDELVAELVAADVIVIGAPMYNFSVSSALKAWIDHIARAGVTFKYTETGPVGQLTGKKVIVFTSRGGVYSEGPAKSMDFHETYLRGVLGFVGLTDVTFVHTEGLALGDESTATAFSKTRLAMADLVAA
ncbi:MAG: FMN-dependent NADH-azoreductase [Massilia sp.]|nr:FMN-dependent NADH-azoreductase [Massilia sp.]